MGARRVHAKCGVASVDGESICSSSLQEDFGYQPKLPLRRISDNEYSLWEILHGDRHGYGWGSLSHEDLEELQVLSKHAEGWIWTGPAEEHTPQLVTFAQWESIRIARGKVTIDHGFEEAE
jgi:hypothetical protein